MKYTHKRLLELFLIGSTLVLPFLIIFPSINQIPYPALSPYSDLVISHIQGINLIRNGIYENGTIPLWSNNILSGYPFISDPLSSIWYPPLWLSWIFSIPITINLLVISHLLIAEIGMYIFLRRKNIHPFAAILGAIMVGIAPKVLGHYGAGHITLIFAYAWTPWILLFSVSDMEKKKIIFPWVGWVLAFIIFADLRWFPYALSIYLAFSFYSEIFENKEQAIIGKYYEWIKKIGFNISFSIILCLPYLSLVYQYSSLSTRSLMTTKDQMVLALPLEALLGFFFPNMAGYCEWITYSGAFVILLMLEILFTKIKPEYIFWLIMLFISIIFATGNGIFSFIIHAIPGLDLLRVPSRSLFICIIALSVLCAYGIDLIIQEQKKTRILFPFWRNLIVFGLGIFSILIAGGMSLILKDISIKFIWGAAIYNICFIFLAARDQSIISGKTWGMIMVPLMILDLLSVGYSQIRFESYESSLVQKEKIVQFINKDGIEGRVYSPSYSIPQQLSSKYKIQMADGINPMQLKEYAAYMSKASGVSYETYGVTIPPFKTGNPAIDNQKNTIDTKLLGKLNVKYIVSEYEIINPTLKKLSELENTWIYENLDYEPRIKLIYGNKETRIENYEYTGGYYSFEAKGPGKIILSEIYYPGWTGYVDGEKIEITSHERLFISMDISEGIHQITIKFLPDILLWGILISLISICVYGGFTIGKSHRY